MSYEDAEEVQTFNGGNEIGSNTYRDGPNASVAKGLLE